VKSQEALEGRDEPESVHGSSYFQLKLEKICIPRNSAAE